MCNDTVEQHLCHAVQLHESSLPLRSAPVGLPLFIYLFECPAEQAKVGPIIVDEEPCTGDDCVASNLPGVSAVSASPPKQTPYVPPAM